MAYRCPMCGKEVEDDLKVYTDHVEDEIVKLIKEEHPEWADRDGTCQKCYDYFKNQLKG